MATLYGSPYHHNINTFAASYLNTQGLNNSTKVDAGDFKHELLNRLRSTMAVNVLSWLEVPTVQHDLLSGNISRCRKYRDKILEYWQIC